MTELSGGQPTQTAQLVLTPLSWNDVDHHAEWSKRSGWDVDMMQLSPGPTEIRLDHFALPGLVVSHYPRKQAMKDFCAVPAGQVVFMVARVERPIVLCGRELPPTLLAVVRSGREHWIVTPAGWDCYEFMISEDLVRRTEVIDPGFFEQTTQLEPAFLPVVEPVARRFLERLDWFFQTARGANGSPGTPIHQGLFLDFVIEGLQQVFDAGLQARGSHEPRRVRRADLVANARDFALARLRDEVSAEDMAQALGVSYRVLNYAFKDALGMSPYQYLLALRLRAVRRQLAASGSSVTDASFGHGFYTPSRFARQYAHFFGERPSQTRDRARRRA